MAYSTLTLYQNCKIRPENNFWVDNVNTYLGSLDETVINNFQYIKDLSLDLNIKVNLPQVQSNKPIYNYVAIVNSDNTRVFYYFILECNWRSENTVELKLSMDTINTFQDKFNNNGFKDTTQIVRQHKNRFVNDTNTEAHNIIRIVDKENEGINGVTLTRNSLTEVTSDNWYLIYTSDSENGISCYLTNKNGFLTGSDNKGILYPSEEIATGWVFLFSNIAGDLSFIVSPSSAGEHTETCSDNTWFFLAYSTEGTNANWRMWKYENYAVTAVWDFLSDQDYIKFTQSSKLLAEWLDPTTFGSGAFRNYISYYRINMNSRESVSRLYGYDYYVHTYGPSESRFYVNGINDWDRTRSEIVKIVECPYCPVTISNEHTLLDNGWVFVNQTWGADGSSINAVKLNDINLQFTRDLYASNVLDASIDIPALSNRPTLAKNSKYESKLYNSSFYIDKWFYDSFTKEVIHENITPTSVTNVPLLNIKYVQSSNISSKLLFDFKLSNATYKYTDDFDNILICNRNNEYPIYNNEYINYLRNGYNYDVKSKNQQTAYNWFGTGIQVVGAIASLAAGVGASGFTGGVSAAAGISLATSAIASIASNINNTVTQENAIQQKLEQAKAQSASVQNADDLSLLNYYCGNNLRHCTYTISDNLKNQLFDLFYRCGYACQTAGIPDTDSRRSFNYIQCNPVFVNEKDPEWLEYLDDIKQRFNSGVTRMHRFQKSMITGLIYDWDFALENWEIYLCPRTFR